MSRNEALLKRRKKIVPRGLGMATPLTVVSGSGSVLVDEEDRQIIDFASGIGVNGAGHCPKPVVDAVCAQASELLHTCIMVATYEPYVALCEKLADMFPHGDQTKVLLTCTGSESVENAVKIARQATGRSGVLGYSEAFHGRTMMAMTLTSKVGYKKHCGPFAPDVYRLPFPNFYHAHDGLDEQAFVRRELYRLREFFHNTVPAAEIAAVILEVVQGEGGFNVVPGGYLRGLRRICDEHGILLIIDEVQSGFCRTGAWAAYHHFGVTPDLSTWAKAMGGGLPIGAVIGKAEIMDAAAPGTLGGTYPGNPVACAAALANIAHMEDLDMNRKAAHIGERLRSRLEALQKRCPAVGDVRGLGAMLAMELVVDGDPRKPDSELNKALIKACWERGLLLLAAGIHGNVTRFLVPLVISDELLDRGLNIVEEELLRLWRKRST